MERPKQPTIFKRHRNRGFGERQPKKETRETRQNFWKHAVRGYESTPHGIATKKRHQRLREKAKRSKRARKRNRGA